MWLDVLRWGWLEVVATGKSHASTNYSGDHVRRRGHTAVAGLAREHAQAVRTFGRTDINIPAGAWADIGPRAICTADRDHKRRFSFRGGGAIARVRHQGGH